MLAAAEKHRLVEEARLGDAEYDDAPPRPSWLERLTRQLSRRVAGD